MTLSLKPLSVLDGKAEWDMLQDLPSENGYQNDSYGIALEAFDSWLLRCIKDVNGIDLPEGYVSQHYYWLLESGTPIGFAKFRPILTNHPLDYGGHIGYGICQRARGKGYATPFLALILDRARAKGLDMVKLTVNDDNPASFKAIEHLNGILEKTVDGHRHYWIYL